MCSFLNFVERKKRSEEEVKKREPRGKEESGQNLLNLRKIRTATGVQ
jgi:hypothetical protein